MKFEDLQFKKKVFGLPGIQAIVRFPNGYGASVIRGPYTYGGTEGLYELGVLHDGKLCYDSGLTSDVFGNLAPCQVTELLEQIELLPMLKQNIGSKNAL